MVMPGKSHMQAPAIRRLWRPALIPAIPFCIGFGALHSPTRRTPEPTLTRSREECTATPPSVTRGGGGQGIVLASPPLRLVSLAFYDLQEKKVQYSNVAGGKHHWPGMYDLTPRSGVRTQWEPVGDFTSGDVVKLIASDCYRTTVSLNGVPLGTFDEPNSPSKKFSLGDKAYFGPCPQSKACLYLKIAQSAWASAKPSWVLDIHVTRVTAHQASPGEPPTINAQGDVVPVPRYDYRALARSRTEILPNPQSQGSYFAAKIYPTFEHERCQGCHAMGDVASLTMRHEPVAAAFANYTVAKTSSPTGPVITCNGGCHSVGDAVPGEVFDEIEWKAPAFERDINWAQKTVVPTCARVRENLPTEAKARHHFFEDARIAWAVSNGHAPNNRSLGRAPPKSFAAWKELLEPWLQGAMPCP